MTVASIGYADDCYPIRNDTRQLRQPLEMTAAWLKDTGQVINASKSLSFEANDENPTEVLLDGEVMPRKKNFKSLGIELFTVPTDSMGEVMTNRIAKAKVLLVRTMQIQGGFTKRMEIISTLILATGICGAEGARIDRAAL